MTINVELKTGIFWYKDLEKKVLELTKEMEMEDRVIYSSFNHYSIAKISCMWKAILRCMCGRSMIRRRSSV